MKNVLSHEPRTTSETRCLRYNIKLCAMNQIIHLPSSFLLHQKPSLPDPPRQRLEAIVGEFGRHCFGRHQTPTNLECRVNVGALPEQGIAPPRSMAKDGRQSSCKRSLCVPKNVRVLSRGRSRPGLPAAGGQSLEPAGRPGSPDVKAAGGARPGLPARGCPRRAGADRPGENACDSVAANSI